MTPKATRVQAIDLEAKEAEHILYANAAVTYSSILIKVYVMFEHALQRGTRWLLKTDDDAYVNIPQTVQARPAHPQRCYTEHPSWAWRCPELPVTQCHHLRPRTIRSCALTQHGRLCL